jgi:hypothetical protein
VTLAAGLLTQTGDNRLTNAEIESMLMAGLPESTIQMKIEAAALRGLVDLDASSNALIALKQKGATERVLNAVVWAEPFGARGNGSMRKIALCRASPAPAASTIKDPQNGSGCGRSFYGRRSTPAGTFPSEAATSATCRWAAAMRISRFASCSRHSISESRR